MKRPKKREEEKFSKEDESDTSGVKRGRMEERRDNGQGLSETKGA